MAEITSNLAEIQIHLTFYNLDILVLPPFYRHYTEQSVFANTKS